MSQIKRLLDGLKFTRKFSRGILAEFETPEQWLSRPHGKANHALWFAGHVGFADNFGISLIDSHKAVTQSPLADLFGMGSTPSDDLKSYPPITEVRAWMDDRRTILLQVASGLSDDDLDRPTPEAAPPFLPDIGSVLQFLMWHEGLHAGQISVIHRSLGHAPLVGRPAEETAD